MPSWFSVTSFFHHLLLPSSPLPVYVFPVFGFALPPPSPPSAPSLISTLVSKPEGGAYLRSCKNTDSTPASLGPIFADPDM